MSRPARNSIKPPSPGWHSLAQGVLRIRGTSADPYDKVVSEFCKKVADHLKLMDFDYAPSIEDGARSGLDNFTLAVPNTTTIADDFVGRLTGHIETFADSSYINFRIGDTLDNGADVSNKLSDGGRRTAAEAIEWLHEWLENGLRRQLARGECRLLARVGSPVATDFTEVPHDVFNHFKIEDWVFGVARAAGGDCLYSIHIQIAETERRLNPIEGSSRAAVFAKYLLEHENGQRTCSWGELGERFKQVMRQKSVPDTKVMREGLRMAQEAAERGRSGVPGNSPSLSMRSPEN